MTRGIPQSGDVLFTTEAPLGNVALMPSYKAALAQRILTLCPNKNILHNRYLLYLLMFPSSRRLLESKSTGSTVLGIKQSVFRRIKFQFPGIREQKEIARLLDDHELRISIQQQRLEKLKLIKQGLMSDLLTGRVRVQVDASEAN